MKHMYNVLNGKNFLVVSIGLLFSFTGNAQVFWTEDFNNGCANNCSVTTYTGPNGTWTETPGPGNLGFAPNVWYVSCAENGHTNTVCGSGCVPASATATLACLHIGSTTIGDIGAAYDAGGCFGGCTDSDTRAESPLINCTGQSNITLTFTYLEFGETTNDDGWVEYFDGTTWSILSNTAKTPCCGGPCNGSLQGQWTLFTAVLPASANNNPGIKIGFHWINNDDGIGTDPSFAIDNMTLSVPSSSAPVAAFTASATSVCVGQAVNFTDNSTGGPTSWSWTFPSATPASATTQNVTGVVWNTAGTYTVTLTATNSNGSNSTTQVITVNPTPTVTATANPTTICVGQQSTLTGAGAATYVWNPGNISGSPINVSPAATTTYTVTGTTAAGCSSTASVTVTVQPCNVPQVQFLASDTTICVGDCINFTDQSTNSPTSWSWSFSGAATATSTLQNPTNICYNSPGTFAVTLIATNANGNGSLTKTGYITVSALPTANAGPDATICTGQSTTLIGSGGVTYNWQPGNQSTQNYFVTPATTTTYTLTVTDANGCTNTDLVVYAPAFTVGCAPTVTRFVMTIVSEPNAFVTMSVTLYVPGVL